LALPKANPVQVNYMKLLYGALIVAFFLGAPISAQQQTAQHFHKEVVSFDYPAGWTVRIYTTFLNGRLFGQSHSRPPQIEIVVA
jgi:hypothetical protein